jgi:hypothetical protein
MDETELSKMLDQILSGLLKRPAVEALLIASSGALLHDSRLVKAGCREAPRFKVVWEEWDLLCNRILAAYDHLLTYYDVQDQDILESAFETVSVSLYERDKLLGLLPISLRPVAEEVSVWEQNLDQVQITVLDYLDSLMGRKTGVALKRYVTRLIKKLRHADSTILEELEEDEADAYEELSVNLFGKLRSLCRQGSPEERLLLLGAVEELMEDRLAFQKELLAEIDC